MEAHGGKIWVESNPGKGKEIHLMPKEFAVLRYLVSQGGRPVPHRQMLQAVWGPDYGDESDYLRVFVNHLRKKIESNPAKPKYILTEPWIGYRFVLPETDEKGVRA